MRLTRSGGSNSGTSCGCYGGWGLGCETGSKQLLFPSLLECVNACSWIRIRRIACQGECISNSSFINISLSPVRHSSSTIDFSAWLPRSASGRQFDSFHSPAFLTRMDVGRGNVGSGSGRQKRSSIGRHRTANATLGWYTGKWYNLFELRICYERICYENAL